MASFASSPASMARAVEPSPTACSCPRLTGNYYATDKTAQHEARVHPKGIDVSARQRPIDAAGKTGYKGADLTICSIQHTRPWGRIRPQGGESHEGTMADAQNNREWVVARRGALCAGNVRMDRPTHHRRRTGWQ